MPVFGYRTWQSDPPAPSPPPAPLPPHRQCRVLGHTVAQDPTSHAMPAANERDQVWGWGGMWGLRERVRG